MHQHQATPTWSHGQDKVRNHHSFLLDDIRYFRPWLRLQGSYTNTLQVHSLFPCANFTRCRQLMHVTTSTPLHPSHHALGPLPRCHLRHRFRFPRHHFRLRFSPS